MCLSLFPAAQPVLKVWEQLGPAAQTAYCPEHNLFTYTCPTDRRLGGVWISADGNITVWRLSQVSLENVTTSDNDLLPTERGRSKTS